MQTAMWIVVGFLAIVGLLAILIAGYSCRRATSRNKHPQSLMFGLSFCTPLARG